jgi:asparagine synthase (glutamine-hydrolysing)
LSAIAGAVHVDGRDMSPVLVAAIADAAAPRGFDGQNRWHDGPAGLIRFAHATTPEAVGERQPFVSAQSQAVMAFDGRLDNRAEVLALLGERGPGLSAAPDGEIALSLFDKVGDDFVKSLAGDFAVAIWQPAERRLLLTRSVMGWRPLLWTFDGATFAFATEPRALVVGLGMERRLNEGAIGEFLAARFNTQTDTFWQGLSRLPPGSSMAVERGVVRQWHWHDGPFEDLSDLPEDEHVERFRRLFDQALIATTRGATPICSQLSGGMDSSSVFSRATELHRAGAIAQPISAISGRFPGEPQDESRWSGAVEAHLGVDARVTGRHPFDIDEARAWCASSLQLPIRPNVLDTTFNALALMRSNGERVLLTGEGGDGWLAGSLAHWPDLFLSGRWGDLLEHARAFSPGAAPQVLAKRLTYYTLAPFFSPAYRNQLTRPNLAFGVTPPSWINPDWARRIGLSERWRSDVAPLSLPTFAQRNRYNSFNIARRHVSFDNVMALAESQGVELRHPLHDLRLTQFYMGAAGQMLNKGGEKKHILREAMRGALPELVRTRTTKARFMAHIIDASTALFRQRAPEDLLCVKLGWVDGAEIRRIHAILQRWREEGLPEPAPREPGNGVWFVLAMDMWLEHAVRL